MCTIRPVAKLAGVSVRPLHHYDAIGLIAPSARTTVGYRLRSISRFEHLQQAMFYRELGFDLRRIAELMSDPNPDREQAFLSQRAQIEKQALRLDEMLDLIDRTLRSLGEETQMAPEEMFDVFGDFDPSQYEDEVTRRWGQTDAYEESARRKRGYAREDWERIRDENAAIAERVLDAFDRGIDPTAQEAMDLAEAARLAIDHAFYPCSHEMHAALAEGYVTDRRFRAFYDDQRKGLAAWFAAVILSNTKRARERDQTGAEPLSQTSTIGTAPGRLAVDGCGTLARSIESPILGSIVSPNDGPQRDAGLLVKLWAGVCTIAGWRCPCPHCGGRMRREIAADEAYVRTIHSRAIGTKPQNYQREATILRRVRTTPVYDVCGACGHRIRRRGLKTTVG